MPGSGSADEHKNYYWSADFGLVHFTSFCTEDYARPWQVGSVQYNWMREVRGRAGEGGGRTRKEGGRAGAEEAGGRAGKEGGRARG